MSDKKLSDLLQQVLDNQVILFKRMDDIECKLKNSSRLFPYTSYEKELQKATDKLKSERSLNDNG